MVNLAGHRVNFMQNPIIATGILIFVSLLGKHSCTGSKQNGMHKTPRQVCMLHAQVTTECMNALMYLAQNGHIYIV